MSNRWIIAAPHPCHQDLAARLRVSPLTAQVLCNRGLTAFDEAKAFFDPKLNDLLPPDQLAGTAEAAELLVAAARAHRKIVIYGDYDVDGITGTAILWHGLRMAGADVDYYIPHRLEEGYGINEQAIRQIAAHGAAVLITVDCGITACNEIQLAIDLGMQVVLTDHHLRKEHLPPATVTIHPQFGDYAFAHLSGAGVALKLAWAIAQRLAPGSRVGPAFREFLLDATSLAALGTIADVVPLKGENRVLARYGLLGLANSKNTGICALLEVAKLSGQSLESDHVGFRLGPRLNAAGRLGHAGLCVEMFTKADPARATEIATFLEEQNRQRQAIEKKITAEARQLVLDAGMDREEFRAIVLAQPGWHAGVIGIVASRLVDEFCKPAVLVCFEEDQSEPIGQGSARSIKGFALHESLTACQEHLIGCGGHDMAAGLRIHRDCMAAFTKAFLASAAQKIQPEDMLRSLRLDAEIKLEQVNTGVIAELDRLAPFGQANPRPRFATMWVRLAAQPRIVGASQNHIQLQVTDGTTTRKGIGFNLATRLSGLTLRDQFRVAFEPSASTWNGRTTAEMRILDVQVAQ